MGELTIRIRPERDLSFFTISVLAAYYYPPLFIGLSLIAILIFIITSAENYPKEMILPVIAGLLLGAVLSLVVTSDRESAFTGLPLQKVDSFILTVDEDSFFSGKGNLIIRGELLEVRGSKGEECSARGRILLIEDKESVSYMQGEIIQVEAGISPFCDSRELSFVSYGGKEVIRLGWSSDLLRFRMMLIVFFDRVSSRLPVSVEALFRALFRGNGDLLEREFKENFRKSGVPHLLALSGFHVAVVVLVLTGALSRFAGARIASLPAIPFLLAYLVFAGGSPSLVRAVIMFTLASLFRLTGRKVKAVPLLMFSCLIQLLLRPVQGWSLSFQLSYLALWGLIVFGKRISSALETHIPSFLNLPLSASIGAHLATAPLLVLVFGELYPVGLISSLLLTPLIVLFMWISLIAFAAHLPGNITFLSPMADWISTEIYDLTEHLVEIFSRYPALVFSDASSALLYFILIALVVLWLYRHVWRKNGRAEKPQFKLRFTVGNQGPPRADGARAEKEMEPEFSD